MKIKKIITCVFFVKIWQCLTLCSSQSKRLTIAKCKMKNVQIKFYAYEVSDKILPSPQSIQIESDSSRCLVFFTDTVWIVGPLGQDIYSPFFW